MLQPNDNSSTISSSGVCGQVFEFNACQGHELGRYAWAFLSLLCFAVGFPASVFILWDFFKNQRPVAALTPNDLFILNLATMDAVFLAFIPPGLVNQFAWNNVAFEALWNGVYALNTCGRPLLMACACVDCFVAVVHPVFYHRRKSLVPRVVMIGLVWALTLGSAMMFSCSYKIFFSHYPTVIFVIAVATIVVCDCCIIWSLRQSAPGKTNVHPQKKRAIHTLTYSLVMAVISYLPPVICFQIGRHLINSNSHFMCDVGFPVLNTSAAGSAVMPLLFLYNAGRLGSFRFACSKL